MMGKAMTIGGDDRPKESESRTLTQSKAIPTLAQMASDGQAEVKKYRQRTKESLEYWFRQSQRLTIARTHYGLRGSRFKDFARRIGVDRSSSFELVKLWPHRAKVMARCQAESEHAEKRGEVYHYPGWDTALYWFERRGRFLAWSAGEPTRSYWLTPPSLWKRLDDEFHFDFDPCPFPKPDDWDAMKMEWGQSNYVNAPFSLSDGPGLTAFVRKAIEQQKKGKTSVLILPFPEMFSLLIDAGAEIRRAGRVPFLDVESKEPCPQPSLCSLFILRGKAPE